MSEYEPPGDRSASIPAAFSRGGMAVSFMSLSYTAVLRPMALLGMVPRSSVAFTVTDAAVCATAGDAVVIAATALAAITLMVVNRASQGLARRCLRLIGTSVCASSKRFKPVYRRRAVRLSIGALQPVAGTPLCRRSLCCHEMKEDQVAAVLKSKNPLFS